MHKSNWYSLGVGLLLCVGGPALYAQETSEDSFGQLPSDPLLSGSSLPEANPFDPSSLPSFHSEIETPTADYSLPFTGEVEPAGPPVLRTPAKGRVPADEADKPFFPALEKSRWERNAMSGFTPASESASPGLGVRETVPSIPMIPPSARFSGEQPTLASQQSLGTDLQSINYLEEPASLDPNNLSSRLPQSSFVSTQGFEPPARKETMRDRSRLKSNSNQREAETLEDRLKRYEEELTARELQGRSSPGQVPSTRLGSQGGLSSLQSGRSGGQKPEVGPEMLTEPKSVPKRFHTYTPGDARQPDYSYQFQGPRRYSVGEFEYGNERSYQSLPYYRRNR